MKFKTDFRLRIGTPHAGPLEGKLTKKHHFWLGSIGAIVGLLFALVGVGAALVVSGGGEERARRIIAGAGGGIPTPPLDKMIYMQSSNTQNGMDEAKRGGFCAYFPAGSVEQTRLRSAATIQPEPTTDADPENDNACWARVATRPTLCARSMTTQWKGGSAELIGASCQGPDAFAVYLNVTRNEVAYEWMTFD
jgi:hypothetical protein